MKDIFEQEMSKPTIFVDRNVLSPHYIPEHLPYREEHIERIMKILAPALSQKRPSNLFTYGKTGTGKTCSTKHVLERLESVKEKYGAKVGSIYLNCRVHNTKYQVLLKCVEKAWPNEQLLGYAASHLYEKLLKHIDTEGIVFIVVLDEIDKVKDLDELMYDLTRANDALSRGHLSLIGISNNIAFKNRLKTRSKSTLCEEEMVFAPYDAEQLKSILMERAKEGLKKGMAGESAVALAAAYAAQESGDARYALRLLLKAADLANDRNEGIVERHVEMAKSAVEEDIVLDLISTLPEHQGIVLYAIAKLTESGSKYTRLGADSETGDRLLFSGEVYEQYESLCKEWKMPPRSTRWYREYLNELEMLGLITTTISGKGIRGNTRLIRLAFPPEKVKSAVRKRFE